MPKAFPKSELTTLLVLSAPSKSEAQYHSHNSIAPYCHSNSLAQNSTRSENYKYLSSCQILCSFCNSANFKGKSSKHETLSQDQLQVSKMANSSAEYRPVKRRAYKRVTDNGKHPEFVSRFSKLTQSQVAVDDGWNIMNLQPLTCITTKVIIVSASILTWLHELICAQMMLLLCKEMIVVSTTNLLAKRTSTPNLRLSTSLPMMMTAAKLQHYLTMRHPTISTTRNASAHRPSLPPSTTTNFPRRLKESSPRTYSFFLDQSQAAPRLPLVWLTASKSPQAGMT